MTMTPILYLPHGGGPLPILGDQHHVELNAFLRNITKSFTDPELILMVSAHWEEEIPTVTSGESPELIYDYYGFPQASYSIKYPAPGCAALAHRVVELLQRSGHHAVINSERGFDHGMFIPLKMMYPQANIPCVQLSLVNSLDPAEHIEIGKSLNALREQNVMIIGSGMSYHNMNGFFDIDSDATNANIEFDQWLIQTCSNTDLTAEQIQSRLIQWERAPAARQCHPREEHLIPLHLCYGAACSDNAIAKVVFNDLVMNKKVTALLWE